MLALMLAWTSFAWSLASAQGDRTTAGALPDVRLGVSVEESHAPAFLYTPPTNGGVLLTEVDGRTIRFFYRHGEEQSGDLKLSSYIQRFSAQPCSPVRKPWSEL